jgi:hypothetical protein
MDSASPSLKSAFAAAANALTLLYKHGREESRHSHDAGARDALERVMTWAVRTGSYSRMIPLDDLLSVLKRELETLPAGEGRSEHFIDGPGLIVAPIPVAPVLTASAASPVSVPAFGGSALVRKRGYDVDENLMSAFEDAMNCDSKRTHLQ